MEWNEAKFWEDPCDYKNDTNAYVDYTADIPKDIAIKAHAAIRKVKEYQDEYAYYTHTFPKYEDLLAQWNDTEWFRNVSWVAAKNLLPNEHTFNTSVPDEQIEELIKSDEKLDELLPHMFKGLKLVVASWNELHGVILDLDQNNRTNLAGKMNLTLHNTRAMLCSFYNLMVARKLPVNDDPLDINDIPKFDNKHIEIVIVFRDCMYYVEYLGQVFDKMYKKHSAKS